MAIGISACSGPLLVGALAGASLNHFTPEYFKKTLPLIAGLISISMGIHFVNKLYSLSLTALVITVGTIIGGLLSTKKWTKWAGTTLCTSIERISPAQASASVSAENFMNQLIAMLILFCASGAGIFGALTEGMTGDLTILLTKSILDFFTAATFVSMLGYIIIVIFIPQLIVFIILSLVATFIMALVSPVMIADFTACGGIIMLATGLRLYGIRVFPTASMLSPLLLVMPSPSSGSSLLSEGVSLFSPSPASL